MKVNDSELDKIYDYVNTNTLIMQDRWEFKSALSYVSEYIPVIRTIVESGSYYGGSLCMLSILLDESGIIIGIDPEEQVQVNREFLDEFVGKDRYYHVKGYSTDDDITKIVLDIIGNRGIDILMLDSVKTPEVEWHEYRTYLLHMNKPSTVVMHDIVDPYQTGARDLYNELSRNMEHESFISQHSINNNTMGIGVIYL